MRFYLETQRLVLVATPLDVLKGRLEQDTFTAELPLASGPETVTFPAAWPGDALVIFPRLIEQLEANPDDEPWDGTLVERGALTAVGQLGCKGKPDENGLVEIGYSLIPEARGRGYTTEIVGALVRWLLEQPSVRVVTAECLETNHASVRVLQKTGFEQVGQKSDGEGTLLLWERKA